MMDFLLNYVTLTICILIFIVSVVLLIFMQKRLKAFTKTLLLVIVASSSLYFIFATWCVVSFGSSQVKEEPNILLTDQIMTIKTYDNIEFDGRLRLPESGTADYLVIYVNGSGPNTYNNKRQLSEEKTFQYHDLFAEKVTASGGAYFSYNTRGVTLGEQPPLYSNIDEALYQTYLPSNEVQDVEAIIRTLTSDSRLSDAKVYLLGWSSGTIIAPQVALRNNVRVDALLLAGFCNQSMDAIFNWQQTGGSSMVNMNQWFDYDKDKSISKKEYLEDKYSVAAQLGPFEEVDVNGDEKIDREDFKLLMKPHYNAMLAAIERDDNQWLKENYSVQLTSAWFKDYRKMAPNSEILPQLNLPIYIFQGENDANVPVQDSYDAEESQRIAGKNNVKLSVFAGHDHDLNYGQYITMGTIPEGLQAIFDCIDKLSN